MNIKATRGLAVVSSSLARAPRCGQSTSRVTGGGLCISTSTLAYNHRLSTLSPRKMSTAVHEATDNACHQDRGDDLLRTHLKRLRASPTESLLLDGGTGEELFLRGVPDDRKIWSATAIVHDQYHSVVEEVHKSFIKAGSQAVTTNSYGVTPGVGFTDGEEVKRLACKAGEIARRAVTTSSLDALVLGSLGPQVESYRPDLIMEHEDGVRAYLHPIEGLYPHIDAYLAETMSCQEEACQAVDALSRFYDGRATPKRPILVSFTLNSDGKVRSGESVVEVIPSLVEYAQGKGIELVGVLFESINKALEEIRSTPKVHRYLHHPPEPASGVQTPEDAQLKVFLGAYANRLTPVDPEWTLESSDEAQPMREDLSPEQYWEFVQTLHSREGHGSSNDVKDQSKGTGCVQLLGGCCGIGPSHICALKNHFAEH